MMWLLLAGLAVAGAPAGWELTGEGYRVRTSGDAKHGSKSVVLTSGAGARGYATLSQAIVTRRYRGRRVRLTVWLKTQDVEGWAGAWMRVDEGRRSVAFDNMQDRALRGTHAWSSYSLVLDVPQTADRIRYGGLLSGEGSLWMDGVQLEVVDASVPVTDRMVPRPTRAPANLDFED